MKDQMERIVEEQAAMQAEIARLRGLLEAERNGNQTLQAEVTRSAYMVAEAKAQAEDWRRHHDSAVQRAEMAIERTRVLEADRLQREAKLRDAEARANAAPAASVNSAIEQAPDLSWLKSFVEADREEDDRDGVSALKAGEIPDRDANGHSPGCYPGGGGCEAVRCNRSMPKLQHDRDEDNTPPNGIERRCGTCARWDPHGVQPTSLGTCGAAEAPTYWNELCLAWLAKA